MQRPPSDMHTTRVDPQVWLGQVMSLLLRVESGSIFCGSALGSWKLDPFTTLGGMNKDILSYSFNGVERCYAIVQCVRVRPSRNVTGSTTTGPRNVTRSTTNGPRNVTGSTTNGPRNVNFSAHKIIHVDKVRLQIFNQIANVTDLKTHCKICNFTVFAFVPYRLSLEMLCLVRICKPTRDVEL